MPLISMERPRGGPRVPAGGWSNAGSNDGSPPPKPDDDVIFEILRASRRRLVLRYLDAHGGEAKIGALAEYIAAQENDIDRAELTSSQRKRVYVGLHQAHLPKMDGNDVIEWDRDRGFVELVDASRWLLAYLYFDPAGHRPSPDDADGLLAALRRTACRALCR